MAYTARLEAPSKSNKYYYANNVFYQSGYGLPNCTCYAWGRFYELSGTKPKLCTRNAEMWWSYKDGYSRGKTPKLGAIICWSKGTVGKSSDGAGHVAVVEKIYSNGSILVGQSGYSSKKMFWTTKLSKGYSLSGYKFQGFIYNPAVTTSTSSSSSSSSSTKTLFKCIVTASKLNVRNDSNSDAKIIGSLTKGKICSIVKYNSTKKWGKLTTGGWISLAHTTKILLQCKVTADVLNIRKTGKANAKITGSLKKGTVCNIVKYSDDKKWGKLANGKGWINLGYTTKV